jgi:hypothetical protein
MLLPVRGELRSDTGPSLDPSWRVTRTVTGHMVAEELSRAPHPMDPDACPMLLAAVVARVKAA